MIGTLVSYRAIATNLDRALSNVRSAKAVQRETTYFEANVGSIKSIDDFMSNTRVYRYVLRAFGMGELIPSKALIRKVLEGGIDDRRSLANSLADPRFRELAETFNFARYGSATTSFTRTQSGVVDRFMQSSLEETAGQSNEGVRLALYFQRKAPSVNGIYDILADKALYRVIETAFDLPSSLPAIGVERQAAAIQKKFDVASLKDPQKLSVLIERFATLWDLGATQASDSPVLQLFRSDLASQASSQTLTAIQNLPFLRR
ncbi:MAG: DUF1217 domain-containing protein [Hyphomicrobium sp.]|nr:DUF1217 domain-containing protein [Hyphomicrobium sp.]